MKRHLLLLGAGLLAVSLAACSDGGDSGGDSQGVDGTPGSADEPVLSVAAAFYPLQLAVEQIGAERVSVTSLTQPGAEPHDVELTPRQVGEMAGADLIVYLARFQPAVDDAVTAVGPEASLDVSPAADLTLTAADHGHDHGEDEDDHDARSGEATDPHFWLDPTRYASVAEAVSERLIEIDPDGEELYSRNTAEFTAELAALGEEFSAGLQVCTHRDLVTGHAAFGYLADRFDLKQIGIAGLTPDNEPTATQIRDLVDHVRETGVTTVYAETLASPALTETVAREAGVEVRTLDPIEGVTDASPGSDYFEIMRANLQTLREGQGCT